MEFESGGLIDRGGHGTGCRIIGKSMNDTGFIVVVQLWVVEGFSPAHDFGFGQHDDDLTRKAPKQTDPDTACPTDFSIQEFWTQSS